MMNSTEWCLDRDSELERFLNSSDILKVMCT